METVPLHRLLDRREAAALLEEFGALMPETALALIRAEGRLFAGVGEWAQAELREAGDGIQEAGRRMQETGSGTPLTNGYLYPLLAGPRLAGALVARLGKVGVEAEVEVEVEVLRCLHHSLTLLLAQALEKRTIARETLERYREINLLYDIGETIGACLDPEEMPRLVLEETNRIIRADVGVVLLPAAKDESTMDIKAAFGDAGHAQTLYKVSRHVVEQVRSTGQPAIVTLSPSAILHPPFSILCAPLKAQERVLGCILLGRLEDQPVFTAGDEKLLNALATQTAIALENAHLYALVGRTLERREGQLSTVEEIARELNATLDLEHILGLVMRRCLEATGAERGAIALLAAEDAPFPSVLQIVSPYGFEERLPPYLRHLARQVMDTGQTDMVPGAHLVVPILLESGPLGAILLANSPRGFGPEDETFIGHLAAHAATAIHNARLYERAEQERAKLAAILTDTREPIIVVDEDERVLLLNSAALGFLDAPLASDSLRRERFKQVSADPSLVVGQPLEKVVSETGLVTLLRKAAREGHALTGEVAGPGDTTFYAGVSPIPDVGWVVVMQDISYLKELDDLKSEFLSIASHDLKSPISVIQGYAGMVTQFGELNEMQQESLDRIINASQNMVNLINELLDIVQIEAGLLGQVERCDLAAIVQDGPDQGDDPPAGGRCGRDGRGQWRRHRSR
jgi:GAF domain-containing protein